MVRCRVHIATMIMLLKPISQTDLSKEGATSNVYRSLPCQERLIFAFSYVAPSVPGFADSNDIEKLII